MNQILADVLQVLPLAIKGAIGAQNVIEAAATVFATMAAEGRNTPTAEEIAAVRDLRRRHYPDFFADDERPAGA